LWPAPRITTSYLAFIGLEYCATAIACHAEASPKARAQSPK
jgi:hypothetical protein